MVGAWGKLFRTSLFCWAPEWTYGNHRKALAGGKRQSKDGGGVSKKKESGLTLGKKPQGKGKGIEEMMLMQVH